MSLIVKHKETSFGIGDRIRLTQKINEGGKSRSSVFEGMVIALKGEEGRKMVTVRNIGIQNIGIERIYPLSSPTIEKIEVIKKGTAGTRHAKLYYLRAKSPKEIEKIYTHTLRKDQPAKNAKSNSASGRRAKS
jgi:large subunit ribosomal protein L19